MDHMQSLFGLALFSLSVLFVVTGCGTAHTPGASEPQSSTFPNDPQFPVQSQPVSGIPGEDANVFFRVKWDGDYVAGNVVVWGLVRYTKVVKHRSGSGPNATITSPGTIAHRPITLLRKPGLDDAFQRWAEKVFASTADLGSQMALDNYRKDVMIEVHDTDGRIAAYQARHCWPSEHAPAALPQDAEQAYRERLVLRCESWERRRGNE